MEKKNKKGGRKKLRRLGWVPSFLGRAKGKQKGEKKGGGKEGKRGEEPMGRVVGAFVHLVFFGKGAKKRERKRGEKRRGGGT